MRKNADTHNKYDVVVIGAGIAGETCARRVRAGGLRVALVDHTRIGGEAASWAAIPSKSLLGPANVRWQMQIALGTNSPSVATPRGSATHGEVSGQDAEKLRIARLEREGIVFLRGDAHLKDPGIIDVRDVLKDQHQSLEASALVIATGSLPRPQEIKGLEEAGYWTTQDASVRVGQPTRIVVLDGGPWAVELAQVFRHYGSDVTLIKGSDRLLPREDPEAGQLLAQHLQQQGIRLLLGRHVLRVERDKAGTRHMTFDDSTHVRAEEILVAGKRMPNIDGLGLERLDLHIDDTGIQVDEYCRAGKGVWAVGDVTGVASQTHVALYQARLAADSILGHGHPACYVSVPRVTFTDPQVAATGLTLAEATAQQLDVVSATAELTEGAFQQGKSKSRMGGQVTLHADRAKGVLIGAWAVAADAGEWIALAMLAIRAGIPIATLRDTVEQLPPFSEGLLQALDTLA